MNGRPWPDPGDLVRIRDGRWRVVRCLPHGDCATIEVVGADRSSQVGRTRFVLPFDRYESLPLRPVPRRVRCGEWRRLARRTLADARPGWTSLRAVTRAQIALIPFQLEPAMALVRGVACRFLIADAVGLGKTIQAGLMIAETLERAGEGRVLVVAPASLREQWAGELRERFALDPTLLDSASILNSATAHAIGTNPWAALPLVITSIDYVKRPEVIRSLEALIWDLVVFDEAHALAGRSDRAAASAALATRARAVVMLSATPHSGDQAAFDRLRALGDSHGEFPLLTFRRSRLALDGAAPRHVRVIRVRATPHEQQMHAALQEYADLSSRHSNTPGARLAISVLQRRATSSAASLAASLHRRLSWLTGDAARLPTGEQLGLPFGASEGDSAPDEELSAPALRDRNDELDRLATLLTLAQDAARSESKLTAVRRFLARTGEHAIVFTEYRDTLATIAAALGPGHAQIHGALSLRERHHEVRRFTHGDARLLLATDAASEGLNLQRRCRLVIHLEVPWTPLRVEQRIGRVDRLGQERSVHSIHLLAAGTSEELMAARLAERSRTAEDALAGACAPENDPHLRIDRADAALSSESIDSAIPVTAPLGHDAFREPVSCLDADLLQRECRHIALARELDMRAARTASQRPFETVRRGPRGRRAVVGVRFVFVDANGLLLWESLIGITLPPGADDGLVLSPEALTETATVRVMAKSELDRLQQELTPGLRLAIARNAAIARTLEEQRARLSALVLQPRLFDRRYERARSAQQELLRHALEQVDEHRVRLAPLASSRLEQVRHVFSLFVPPR